MRFAGEVKDPVRELIEQYLVDEHIQGASSGIALLPGGVQGPAQGPNTPIKNYGGMYMPDATQPTGYRPTPQRV